MAFLMALTAQGFKKLHREKELPSTLGVVHVHRPVAANAAQGIGNQEI